MPDFGKITFERKGPLDLGMVFPDSTKNEVGILERTLRYDGRDKAKDLMQLPYFSEYPPKLQKLIPEDKRIKIPIKKYEEFFNIKA